ncbi:MAG: hypothetical protein WD939_09850, partial [Dehalococcoidia bacterium]
MRFPAVLVVLLMLVVLACDEAEPPVPPAPPTVFVWSDASLAEEALSAASELLAARGLAVARAATSEAADLAVVEQQPADGGEPFVTRYWVAAVAPPSERSSLDMATLSEAVSGPSVATRVLVPVEPAPPISSWFSEPATVTEALPIGEIAAALAADHDAIALLPLEAVDVHVRSVPVDGIDVVFGEG